MLVCRLATFSHVKSCQFAILRPSPRNTINFAGSLATAGLGFGINKFIGLFYKQEFQHHNND